jgi:hypothetical protein
MNSIIRARQRIQSARTQKSGRSRSLVMYFSRKGRASPETQQKAKEKTLSFYRRIQGSSIDAVLRGRSEQKESNWNLEPHEQEDVRRSAAGNHDVVEHGQYCVNAYFQVSISSAMSVRRYPDKNWFFANPSKPFDMS